MEYLAVSDYALLRGCSERYVRKMIQQNVLTAEEILGVVGNSGRQYRIPLASIETKYIKKWKRMQAKKNGGQSKTNETEQPIFFTPFAENITAEERDEIALWKNILGEWQKYRDGAKSKKKADAEYLSYLSEKYPGMRFSQRILYRKMEAVKQNGDMALINRPLWQPLPVTAVEITLTPTEFPVFIPVTDKLPSTVTAGKTVRYEPTLFVPPAITAVVAAEQLLPGPGSVA